MLPFIVIGIVTGIFIIVIVKDSNKTKAEKKTSEETLRNLSIGDVCVVERDEPDPFKDELWIQILDKKTNQNDTLFIKYDFVSISQDADGTRTASSKGLAMPSTCEADIFARLYKFMFNQEKVY